jgi:pimeloyl-ACP methyl ester carboxylesterase
MHWAGKVVLGIVLLLGSLAIAGAAYQQIGTWRDGRHSPEPGRLVKAGGLRLQFNCTGSGSPTVVLDSGLGDFLPEWEGVQAGVAGFARVCSYDRAGYGNSDAGSMPRTSAQIATELHAGLEGAGEQPPYLLVGHSFGGYNVRVFTGKYPSEVAGIILVDSPQEDQYKMLPAAWQNFSAALLQRYRKQADTAPFFIGLGIARLVLRSQGRAGKYDYLILQFKYLKARASELENIQSSAEEARSAGGIADKPLIVLTSGKTLGATSISGLNEQGVAQFERIWIQDLQPRLARLSTRGKHVLLPDADHNIPAERPEAIIAAVREICAAVATH